MYKHEYLVNSLANVRPKSKKAINVCTSFINLKLNDR